MIGLQSSLREEAFGLVQSLSNDSGSFSSAVYDTAWVSMVQSTTNSTTQYLFPRAFTYLLRTQLSDGSWPSYSSTTDGILNTLAALLALKTRLRNGNITDYDLEDRCVRAQRALQRMFDTWDIHSVDSVGLEILVPSTLRLLKNEGVHFEFQDLQELTKLGKAKLAFLDEALEVKTQTTLLHSLEAFVGILDFDSMKHHKLPNGSMFNSPSSTAAYLINASIWDCEAEQYLHMVMNRSNIGSLEGGAPSAYPTSIFEITWTIMTLLKSSFSPKDCGESNLNRTASFLIRTLENQGWLMGFDTNCLPDADDTAMSLLTLRTLGYEVNYSPLLATFERDSYFITYVGERNPSFSANCNVLACLLKSEDPNQFTAQIAKCAMFLNKAWHGGKVQDKWNTSPYYPIMLLAHTFTRFIELYDNKTFDSNIDMSHLSKSIKITLFDMYIHVIECQEDDGSWASKHEVTAYAMLALSSLLVHSWSSSLTQLGVYSFSKAKTYLIQNQHLWTQGQYLWIEKVTYSSNNLCYAYCLAAANIPILKLDTTRNNGLSKTAHFFSALPTFSRQPHKVEAYLTQSAYFVTLLQEQQESIFPGLGSPKAHKYLEFIPFTWIGCNHRHNTGVSMSVLWDMMVVSMLNYQADLYMETFVAENLSETLDDVRQVIDRVILSATSERQTRKAENDGHCGNGTSKRMKTNVNDDNGFHHNFSAVHGHSEAVNGKDTSAKVSSTEEHLSDLEATLLAFCKSILTHPIVLLCPVYLQEWLSFSLRSFLQAHITQLSDSIQLGQGNLPKTTYYAWVHTTSANHTSCPYSFVFYLCLMHGTQAQAKSGKSKVDLFEGAKTKYLLEDASRRLAAMCRQQNDVGSIVRDKEEKNLNGVDFPEFSSAKDESSPDTETARVKTEMLEIIEYEKQSMNVALSGLRGELNESVMRTLMLFFHVTSLFGEIYIARDMSPSIKSLGKVMED